jgi:hypothetical protein
MKSSLVLCLLLLVVCLCHSQNYQPFLFGKLHFLSAGQNYSVRIDSAGDVGGDSAFWMTPLALPPTVNCYNNNYTHFVPDQEGYFGDHFIQRSDDSYQFIGRNGDTVTFHTQWPIGSPWTFVSGGSLTAAISQRTTVTIGGNVDSLLYIDVSDGNQYALSQHNGLYAGRNLSFYFNGGTPLDFTLVEPPAVPDFKDFFAWQPGDVYNTVITAYSASGIKTFERWVVLARDESPSGDSLALDLRHYKAQYWYSPTPDTVISPVDTQHVVYTREALGFLEKATYEVYFEGDYYHLQRPWSYNSAPFRRKVIPTIYFWNEGLIDSCGYSFYQVLAGPCVFPYIERFTEGLGSTYQEFSVGWTMTTCVLADRVMPCYMQAGADSVGPCPSEFIALPRNDPFAQLALQVWHNRQTGESGLAWEGMPPADYTWQLYDLNGRQLHKETVMMDGNGQRMLPKPGSAGMYLLRVADAQGTWARTLRVPMLAD